MSSERDDILRECLAREREIEAEPCPPRHQTWAVREWEEEREYGPRFSVPLWFGDEDNYIPERYRSRYLRELWAMHAAKLIIATKTGTRLSHIKLTQVGRMLAEALPNDEEQTS